MNSANKLNAYRVNAVGSASPENLVVMLYDGAIRFLGAAIRAFAHEDPLDFNLTIHTNISKTQAIIRELNHALDLDNGGELGTSLSTLYIYFDDRLQEANINKNKEIIEEVLERITVLRDAWSESLTQQSAAAVSNAVGGAPESTPDTQAALAQKEDTPPESPSLSLIG
jgi:flagellar protein FliS